MTSINRKPPTSGNGSGNGKREFRSFQDLVGRRQHLEFTFEIEDREAAIDIENRTVEMSILSDQPIQQWWFGRVILDHKKTSVRMDRMKAGAPLLLNHRTDQQIGVLENVRVEKGKTRATARFSKSALAEEIFQDVRDGIRRNTSGGFVIHEIKLEKQKDGEDDTYRSTDWEPFEGSIASIPADITVGAGDGRSFRAADDDADEDERPTTDDVSLKAFRARAKALGIEIVEPTPTSEVRTNTMTEAERLAAEAAARTTPVPPTAAQLLQARTTEFIDTAALFGDTDEQKAEFRTMARTLALDDAKTLDDLKRDILASMKKEQVAIVPVSPATIAARQGVVEFSYVSKPRHFKGDNAAERAYRFASWLIAGPLSEIRGTNPLVTKAQTYCRDHGILLTRGQVEGINEAGGYTVAPEFGNDLIDLREEFGVFRRNAKIVPMASDSRSDPRREGGLTAFWEDEADELEESEKKWGRVGLKAKKLTVLDRFSNELNEDSMVNTGDDLAGEIAYAFAEKEDNAGFLGDATKTYGGITGVCTKLADLSATIANIAGLAVATGSGYATSYDSIVLKDLHKTKGRLPAYALKRGPKWYMHQSVWSEVIEALILKAGGITAEMIAQGAPPRLLGYPVEIAQVLPSVPAVDQVLALFGVLDLAARLGDRRQTTISISDQVYWTSDQIGIKGTERLDINVHDVGNASATASARRSGPVVGLITAAT